MTPAEQITISEFRLLTRTAFLTTLTTGVYAKGLYPDGAFPQIAQVMRAVEDYLDVSALPWRSVESVLGDLFIDGRTAVPHALEEALRGDERRMAEDYGHVYIGHAVAVICEDYIFNAQDAIKDALGAYAGHCKAVLIPDDADNTSPDDRP